MNSETFTMSRVELRRLLLSFKVSEKSIEYILAEMEKAHRHMNIITLVSLLGNLGINMDKIRALLRRFGMSDITIDRTIEAVDEHKIMSEYGRIYDVSLKG